MPDRLVVAPAFIFSGLAAPVASITHSVDSVKLPKYNFVYVARTCAGAQRAISPPAVTAQGSGSISGFALFAAESAVESGGVVAGAAVAADTAAAGAVADVSAAAGASVEIGRAHV